MAFTVTFSQSGTVNIIPDGSTAFDMGQYSHTPVMLRSIKLVPSAANDKIQVRDGSATGDIICYMRDSANDGVETAFKPPKPCRPYIVGSECTFGTAANARIIMEI